MEERTKQHEHLQAIFAAAVERVKPYAMIHRHVRLEGNLLRVTMEDYQLEVDLDQYRSICVLGAGKATASMALAIEEILEERITDSVISVKYGHTEPLRRVRMIEAGHPVPDENGLAAAREIIRLAERADSKTLVINLISGGGSALLAAPFEGEDLKLSLEDMQATTQALLASGAAIAEVNCIRKHISRIKGGRLARLLYPARSLNLILSDVVGDRLDAIASGLTVPDPSTYREAGAIIAKYKLREKLPDTVLRLIEKGLSSEVEETPKRGDVAFTGLENILLGTNYTGLLAAGEKAKSLGYNTVLLSSRLTGEAKELAKVFVGISRDVSKYDFLTSRPACLIGGGETTVTLQGRGLGGRNQEIALSFLNEMKDDWSESERIYFLAASSDGNDGPTDAAGAFVSRDLLAKVRQKGLNIGEYLQSNDSYHFFEALGALLKTGPTNTNVCDYQIALIC